MKIIYSQSESKSNSTLNSFGVQACYFKKILLDRDQKQITKKVHHHTGFEIHIITDGYQTYEIKDKTYKLEKGDFLLICPNIAHRVIDSVAHTQKYSLTFHLSIDELNDCFSGKITSRIWNDMNFIVQESMLKRKNSSTLIENGIFEIILSILRMSGMKEKAQADNSEDNVMVSLAKQYIDDNVDRALSVCDVSGYCCLSSKQLTRIFKQSEDISPGEYIKKRRIKRIEGLLANQTLSLKQISEKMDFSSEYYFNEYFKKYAGMPPGEYRKMLGK